NEFSGAAGGLQQLELGGARESLAQQLAVVQTSVRDAEERQRRRPVGGVEGASEAHPQLLVREPLVEAAHERARLRLVTYRREHGELVAADPGDLVGLVCVLEERLGKLAERLVARRMTELVVDAL